MGTTLQGVLQSAIARLRFALTDRPLTVASSMLTLALFIGNLAPFDFVTSTDDLHASFGRAQWSLTSARFPMGNVSPWVMLKQPLLGAGWFSVLGYLLALAGRERGRHPAISLGSALKDGLILASLVAFMQLFTRSHAFDVATVMFRSLGVVFGAWSAVFLSDLLPGFGSRRKSILIVPAGMVVILVMVQIGSLIVLGMNSL